MLIFPMILALVVTASAFYSWIFSLRIYTLLRLPFGSPNKRSSQHPATGRWNLFCALPSIISFLYCLFGLICFRKNTFPCCALVALPLAIVGLLDRLVFLQVRAI